MDCKRWIEFFAERNLLALTKSVGNCSHVLVDGASLVDTLIGSASSAEKLADKICGRVEKVGKQTNAPEVTVHFELAPRLPHPVPCTWSGQGVRLENHMESLMYDKEGLYRFAECLHGDASSTEWPRAILKEAEDRRALWRHPLLQWQIVHGIANALLAYMHYPTGMKRVIVAGVPRIMGKSPNQPFRDTWIEHERLVEGEYSTILDGLKSSKGLIGASAVVWAKHLLTTLCVGYRQPTHRQWPKYSERAYPTLDTSTGIYHQMSQVLYTIAAAARQKDTPVVLIENARDEALPVLLILLHRIRESEHALRIVVNWADKTYPTLDLTTTYENLRRHLSERKSFSVPDLCLAMLMQNSYATGAHSCETDAALVWDSLHYEFLQCGRLLGEFNVMDTRHDVFARGRSVKTLDSGRAECFHWCATGFSTRHFASMALAVSGHRFLEILSKAPTPPRLSHEDRQPDFYIQRLYRESGSALPPSWTCGPPVLPMQALARARRANWFFEYYLCASHPAHLETHVRNAAFEFLSENESVWGFQWTEETALVETEKLIEELFKIDFRLVPRSNRKVMMHFGRLGLFDTVTLQ